MTREDFLRELENMLEVEPGLLNGNEVLNDLMHWDSMHILIFVTLVNDKFGFVIDGVAVTKARTVNDLLKFVEGRFTN